MFLFVLLIITLLIIIAFIFFKRYIYSVNKHKWRRSPNKLEKGTAALIDWFDGRDIIVIEQ